MCGIFFSASRAYCHLPHADTITLLKCRGPDSYCKHSKVVEASRFGDDLLGPIKWYLTFESTVLALRGAAIQQQPLLDPETGSVLCWNGEAWRIGDLEVAGNDSVQVFRLLLAASSLPSKTSDNVLKTLTSIAGPYAFVFYDATSACIFYGRDRLGRRSLLVSPASKPTLVVCSISTSTENEIGPSLSNEASTSGIYRLDLAVSDPSPQLLMWTHTPPPINKNCAVNLSVPPRPTHSSTVMLEAALKEAVRLRVTDIPTLSLRQNSSDKAKVAILFSGGLDCTLLARLTHDLLPIDEPVELLNVAFENPRSVAANPKNSTSAFESCPDRVTGRSSHAELHRVCPSRNWRFVAIDVPFSATLEHRLKVVELMQPHNTEMDLSIAMALYFAARGVVDDQHNSSSPTSPASQPPTSARVLLSGLGADELFAGYSRHAAAFTRHGFQGLVDELELDFNRIGHRNLGRDDRVISHWGREVRYPYLDEAFVEWALGLPAWEKCGFRIGCEIPKSFGEPRQAETPDDLDPAKMLLRLLAWDLGMKRAAQERKRAIQFGARTAKMEIGKGRKKGTDLVAKKFAESAPKDGLRKE